MGTCFSGKTQEKRRELSVAIVDFKNNKALLTIDLNPEVNLLEVRSQIQEQAGISDFTFVNGEGQKLSERRSLQNTLMDGNLLFISIQQRQQQKKFIDFKCEKAHDLYFLDQFDLLSIFGKAYLNKINIAICSLCKKTAHCRTICPQCSVKDNLHFYCTSCKKTPCTKYTCPSGHQMKKVALQQFMCDVCGTTPQSPGAFVYKDDFCIFEVCQPCYLILPETHDLVPLKTPKSSLKHLYIYK